VKNNDAIARESQTQIAPREWQGTANFGRSVNQQADDSRSGGGNGVAWIQVHLVALYRPPQVSRISMVGQSWEIVPFSAKK
jgi:hypothetical protein